MSCWLCATTSIVCRERTALDPAGGYPLTLISAMIRLPVLVFALAATSVCMDAQTDESLRLNDLEYLEMRGLNVMLAHDFYPESHQGGVGIIQNGLRVATNGDLRLEPTPGQWQPTPVVGPRQVDRELQEISVRMTYPDESKDRKGFNPIVYPDLRFNYVLRVRPEGRAFRIIVDLDEPLPAEWIGRVGFNLELFPGFLFGKSYRMGDEIGIFPRQPNGPAASPRPLLEEFTPGQHLDYELAPLGRGPKLIVAPESEEQRMTIEAVRGGELLLLDGRAQHTNGWFVVRALVSAGAREGAIEWLVTPHVIADWKSTPVVQVSQVGYHPHQQKVAVIELDRHETDLKPITLYRATERGLERVIERPGKDWGRFLRYRYLQLDFTEITESGMYLVRYGDQESSIFQINERVYQRHVWQPTIEYFLPAQMCHMRVNDRYRVWHDVCHLDDARMAPVNHNHFDGYIQGPSTLTHYEPGEHVPGLDVGAWHDAGDYDLRVESQADTIQWLSHAWELFRPEHDNTWIDQKTRIVEIHRPDGKPDVLQQIEHGALGIVSGYKALGRLYRGVIEPTLRQYVHLGDAAAMSDNVPFKGPETSATPAVGLPGSADDRWVFTEQNPRRELDVAAGLAAAARALRGFNDELATDCDRIARDLWRDAAAARPGQKFDAAVELLQTTGEGVYAEFLKEHVELVKANPDRLGWIAARSLPLVDDDAYRAKVREALTTYRKKVDELERETPYGLPYKPGIWGAGWGVQRFGVEQYFLHTHAPDIFPAQFMLHALNFVLGVHPGPNTASFASGVGAKSLTTAYGTNRADWSYIPGGIGSGTALIRPDYPEMLHWPFLWQQTEYCLGEPTSDYVFLVLAADHVLNR
jgi:endoglucanase